MVGSAAVAAASGPAVTSANAPTTEKSVFLIFLPIKLHKIHCLVALSQINRYCHD